jgi:DnaD/phage-associated family protein
MYENDLVVWYYKDYKIQKAIEKNESYNGNVSISYSGNYDEGYTIKENDQKQYYIKPGSSPMEYEIINSWLDTGYDKELIISALKEAVFNGVFKLNYIDKILYEWNKKGIKTPNDIEKDKVNYSKKKEEKKELYDYNWLEDE